MLGHVSRRVFLSVLSSVALSLGAGLACKCPETTPELSPLEEGAGGSSGPMTVHGRSRFYSPSTAVVDVKVHENGRPLNARRMDVWWDSHTGGGPTYAVAPNARFIKIDLTKADWEIDGILADYTPGDTLFRIKVIVYDKNGVNITKHSDGRDREFQWEIGDVEPLPIWHELIYY